MGTWSLGRVRLVFPEGHPQHGLEVLMRRRRLGEAVKRDLGGAVGRPSKSDDEFDALDQDGKLAYLATVVQWRVNDFAGLLVSWNFTDDDGEPVPTTAEGVALLDDATFTALSVAYNEATTVVAPPLPQRSNDGEPSEEELTLPQEPL